MTEGVDGLLRDGSPPARHSCADRAAEIVRPTEAPPHEATPWTARAMAKTTGRAVSTVQKIWNAHGLAPRRRRSVELSSDPAFAEKPVDVAGLSVEPPAHAVMLPLDETSRIQALDRTRPGRGP